MHAVEKASGTVSPRQPVDVAARKRRKKALTTEGLQIGYVFQSLLQDIPLNFQTLLPFPNFIVTEHACAARNCLVTIKSELETQ
jgi:hypothetical protein